MPDLSIVVCTYNRQKYIRKTLEHLNDQSAPYGRYEVILVNNKSTDDTASICQNYMADNPSLNMVYVVEENQGHTYARNRGIEESSSDLIAFIDDDAFVRKDYVENIIDFFSRHESVAAIGGKIIPEYESSEPKWMSKYLLPLVSALDMGDQSKPFPKSKFPIGANMAYRKAVFKKHGQFDVALGRRGSGLEGGDEKDMIFRIKKADEQVFYVPNMEVRHIIPDKRLDITYIKGLADGVARSEMKRLSQANFSEKLFKIFDELVKIGGTLVLAVIYFLSAKGAKAQMLIKFRQWVVKSYLEGIF